jgi:hypothetical protein
MQNESGLIGHWPLEGDCADHSGQGLHGVNHGVDLDNGEFDGQDHYIEIPDAPCLDIGTGEFAVSAWVYTAPDVEGVTGDLLSKYDPALRRGFNLSLHASAGGYNSQGDDRHVSFGIDDGRTSDWIDCGRPNATSNYVSNSLTVFDGHLYAATTDGATEQDWCHVYRYAGEQRWEDCGRVGHLRTHGVGPLIVHRGHLYAATWSYDWTRVASEALDHCRVYRYEGGQEWVDCGQPGQCRRLFGIASYRGRLYVVGDDARCHVSDGDGRWQACGQFPNYGHPMAVHAGRLYAGVLNPAAVYAYDGSEWTCLGNPLGSERRCNQIHALEVYRGRLHATTWPEGTVARYEPGAGWIECGRLGDSTEVNGLVVYNGKLYGGTIPRAEVFRFEESIEWMRLHRFFDPPGWEPIPVEHEPAPDARARVGEWTRVTSLTVYAGRLFASIGSCTSSVLDAPCDVRGRVFAMQAGNCATFDQDLGPGWKHLVASRTRDCLELWIDGRFRTSAPAHDGKGYPLTNSAPLKIGGGETASFSGKIRDVRLYNRALDARSIERLYQEGLPRSQARP